MESHRHGKLSAAAGFGGRPVACLIAHANILASAECGGVPKTNRHESEDMIMLYHQMTRRRFNAPYFIRLAAVLIAAMPAIVPLRAAAASQTAGAAHELVGLWKAQRHFGPSARGTLLIDRENGRYFADIMGGRFEVAEDGTKLAFALPNGQGKFVGRLQKSGAIAGHWYPPRTLVSGGGFWFASPVVLQRVGKSRWQGELRPLDDIFTLYLNMEMRDDGTLGAFLRNPERNMAAFLDVQRVALKGDDVTVFGKRRGETEESELLRGAYDRQNEILTIFWPERGGAFDFRREGDDSLFYPRGKIPPHYVYRPPPARDDGWPTANLEDVGIDRGAIERFIQAMTDQPIADASTPELQGILIARYGKLVLEEYFHGEHRDKPHDTRSAAKSLTATIVGAALQAGAPLSLSSGVYDVMNGGVPEGLEPRKRAMTLEHLLTMSSGFFCDDSNPDAPGNEDAMLDQSAEPDFYAYALRVPMAYDPGAHSVYCSINPNLALGMVGRAMGESPMAVFDRLIGEPLKIERYGWFLDPAGNPYGGGSVSFLPRDFMKLGQLMLDGGMWKGKRILAPDFVERASAPLYHLRNFRYGYLWWVLDVPYKDRTVRGYLAGGNGGQGVLVFPELDLVIATWGGSYASRVGLHIQQEIPVRYILPAVREGGDDPNEPVVFGDWTTPYGPSDRNTPVAVSDKNN